MECYCYLRNVQDLLTDEKTLNGRRFGEPFKGPRIPFEQWLSVTRFQYEISLDFTNLARKFYQEYFLVRIDRLRNLNWKRDVLVADIEELENMDASEIYPQRIIAKEVLITQEGEECISPVADGTARMSGRDYEFREPLQGANKPKGVKVPAENFKANPKSLNRQN